MKRGLSVLLVAILTLVACGEKAESVRDRQVDQAFQHLTKWEYAPAADLLERAHKLFPEDPLILNNLAVTLAHQKKFDRALDLLIKAKTTAGDSKVGNYMLFSVASNPNPSGPPSSIVQLKSFPRQSAKTDGLPPPVTGDIFLTPGQAVPREISWLNRQASEADKQKFLFLRTYVVENIDSVQTLVMGR